jgi:xanthine dehydrogenase accessory factor
MPGQAPRVVIVGAGELGSAVAHRLVCSGMEVLLVDLAGPVCIRTGVCFAIALIDGSKRVEGVTAARVASPAEAIGVLGRGEIPVAAVGRDGAEWRAFAGAVGADVAVDARMLKRDSVISKDAACFVVGLGPGFTAGADVDAVVETNRGHDLGKVIYDGRAEADTGIPGSIEGHTADRVIRACRSGRFLARVRIGALVVKGEVVGVVEEPTAGSPQGGIRGEAGDEATDRPAEVAAPLAGLVRGLITDGATVERGQKIGDIDPRGKKVDPFTISDKGRAVAGGVLEAIMHWWTTSHA